MVKMQIQKKMTKIESCGGIVSLEESTKTDIRISRRALALKRYIRCTVFNLQIVFFSSFSFEDV